MEGLAPWHRPSMTTSPPQPCPRCRGAVRSQSPSRSEMRSLRHELWGKKSRKTRSLRKANQPKAQGKMTFWKILGRKSEIDMLRVILGRQLCQSPSGSFWKYNICPDVILFQDKDVTLQYLFATGSSSDDHVIKLKDLVHQHVLYVLRKNPDVTRHLCRFFIVVLKRSHINIHQWATGKISSNSCHQGFTKLCEFHDRVQQVTEGVYLIDGQEVLKQR